MLPGLGMHAAVSNAEPVPQKTKEEDGSITFSFPKDYLFQGGIEDAPPPADENQDSVKDLVSPLGLALLKQADYIPLPLLWAPAVLFWGGIEDAPPAADENQDSVKDLVSPLGLALLQQAAVRDWLCLAVLSSILSFCNGLRTSHHSMHAQTAGQKPKPASGCDILPCGLTADSSCGALLCPCCMACIQAAILHVLMCDGWLPTGLLPG